MKNHMEKIEKDVWLYRMVVAVLGLTVVSSVLGTIVLAMAGQSTPEVIVALGSAAIGGLAGLLTPSPLNRKPLGKTNEYLRSPGYPCPGLHLFCCESRKTRHDYVQ